MMRGLKEKFPRMENREMYRSDDFLVSGVVVGRLHRLAEAIRRGCKLRPKKVKRLLRRGECGACTLGAAAVGSGMNGRYSRRRIVAEFPELRASVQHPVSGRLGRLENIVVWLNDYSDFTREEVADWLCRLGGCEHPLSGGKKIPIRSFLKTTRTVHKGDGCYHRVAEAMRLGCALRPKKVKNHFWVGKNGACALGAVIAGAGQDLPKNDVFAEILRCFPELNNVVDNPVTGYSQHIFWAINNLNDDTDYSREEIADWLCDLDGCQHPRRCALVAELVA